jgi:8-oxo-dGTP pyrophosphatase MutT (NUDIX family)
MDKALRKTTLVYLRRRNQLLLGCKKRGFGLGKWNGMGGKLDPIHDGTDMRLCAARECSEECGLKPTALRLRGILQFYYEQNAAWNNQCYVYESWKWDGGEAPIESDEMRPDWIDADKLDYSLLWEDDKHWLPQFIKGQEEAKDAAEPLFFFSFFFDGKGALGRHVEHKVEDFKDLSER